MPKVSPAPKRQKALQRQPPPGTKLEAQEKDGNCMYRSMASALNRGRKEQSFHHLELRARVATHIQAHPEWYEQEWKDDGSKGPDGQPCASWDDFIKAICKPGSFSGDLELRALCKLTKTKVVLIPEDPNFSVVAYGKKWASTTHCFFYTTNHFDYLAPTGDAYPKDLLDVVADPCGGFLVGGVSELGTESASSVGRGTRAADLRTEPTVSKPSRRPKQSQQSEVASIPRRPATQAQASNASSCGPGTFVSMCGDVDFGECSASDPHQPSRPQRVVTPPADVATMLRLKLFQCRLCNFKQRGSNRVQLLGIKNRHMKRHHPGHPLLNTSRQLHTTRMIQVKPGDDVAWKCPLCDIGITKEEHANMTRSVAWQVKFDHRGDKHPRITKERWKEILRAQRKKQGVSKAFTAANRITQLSRAGLSKACAKLPSHCVPFLWPTPLYAKSKQGTNKPRRRSKNLHIRKCVFINWIKCRRCGHLLKGKNAGHFGAKCPPPRTQQVIDRQLQRTKMLQAWLGDKEVPGMTPQQVQATFASAIVAIRETPLQHSSPC